MKKQLIVAAFLASSCSLAYAQGDKCPDIPAPSRTVFASANEYATSNGFSIDAEGIVVFDYKTAYNNLGKYRNAYFVSNYAGALYRDYLGSECSGEAFLNKFMLQANWLLSTGERRGDMLVWTYPFAQPVYGSRSGWISGIAQSRIAGIMQRAFAITGDKKFHDAAEAAMRTYETDIRNGGVVTKDDEVTWIEEVADPDGKSFKILNGHITALAGILDFYQVTKEPEWKAVFDRGIAAVKRDLPKFDAGFTSWYSLGSAVGPEIAARKDYNSLHVSQLLWLYAIAGDVDFLRYASHFQSYEFNDDRYTALGSTNEKTHGPDQAKGIFGSAYWSHSVFPTWLQVTAPKAETFKGFAIFGSRNGDKAFPRDFRLLARSNGEWNQINAVEGNKGRQVEITFAEPVITDAFRLEILSDNGNKNVALQAAMPIRSEFTYGAVTNDCNYRATTDYNFDQALDLDPAKSMRVYCAGWVILPLNGSKSLELAGQGKDGAMFTLDYSDNLQDWEKSSEVPVQKDAQTIDLQARKFVRVSFKTNVELIDKLILN